MAEFVYLRIVAHKKRKVNKECWVKSCEAYQKYKKSFDFCEKPFVMERRM